MATGVFIGWLSPSIDYGDNGMPEGETRRVGMRVLGLVYTCQRIYDEVIPLLYTLPIFVVNNICTLPWWKDTLHTPRFDSVRSLKLKFLLVPTAQDPDFVQDPGSKFSSNAVSKLADNMWQKTWSTTAQMKGLRNLHVTLDTSPGPVAATMEAEVLETLGKTKDVEDYVVALSWEADAGTISGEMQMEMPFHLVRSTGRV